LAQIFPQWTNKAPFFVLGASVFGLIVLVGLVWYYASPWNTDVGYRPIQPVPYSHAFHASDSLGLDCRFCHTGVETSPVAGIPPTKTCMNCHNMVKAESEKLAPVRESLKNGTPLRWVRVHKSPDYVYFDHSAHFTAGIGCASCHGRIDEMEIVAQDQPLSMGWCLECHRNPDNHLRPASEITNMKWSPPANQADFALKQKELLKIKPPIADCTGCHR
jgi:hypothetical protein